MLKSINFYLFFTLVSLAILLGCFLIYIMIFSIAKLYWHPKCDMKTKAK